VNKQHDEERKELRNFRKEYEIDREEGERSDDAGLREYIHSFVQQFSKSEYNLSDIQNLLNRVLINCYMRAIKYNTPQILPESYQHNSTGQREMNRPDSSSDS